MIARALFILFICLNSIQSQADDTLASRLLNWKQWAQRPASQELYEQLRQQMESDEGPLELHGAINMNGQYHKRPGHFVFVVAAVNYKGLAIGPDRRHARLRLKFAELVAAVFRLREEFREQFPKFRFVVNTPRKNQWLIESFAELGMQNTCDAIMSGNPDYQRLTWEFP